MPNRQYCLVLKTYQATQKSCQTLTELMIPFCTIVFLILGSRLSSLIIFKWTAASYQNILSPGHSSISSLFKKGKNCDSFCLVIGVLPHCFLNWGNFKKNYIKLPFIFWLSGVSALAGCSALSSRFFSHSGWWYTVSSFQFAWNLSAMWCWRRKTPGVQSRWHMSPVVLSALFHFSCFIYHRSDVLVTVPFPTSPNIVVLSLWYLVVYTNFLYFNCGLLLTKIKVWFTQSSSTHHGQYIDKCLGGYISIGSAQHMQPVINKIQI